LGSAPLGALLLRERRRLAVAWLERLKIEAGQVLSEHLRAVRGDAQLRPATELKLAIHAVEFYSLYLALAAMLNLSGIYRTRKLLARILNWSQRLSDLLWLLMADVRVNETAIEAAR
jgi:hypothetical protein